MKALRILHFGTPEQLLLDEVDMPRADSEHAVIKVCAAPINPSDVKNAAGFMSQTTLPRIPGRDFAGVVVDGPSEWNGKEVWGSGVSSALPTMVHMPNTSGYQTTRWP